MMKKIGVIGGLSWVSTADYYRQLNELTQARLGGVHSARLAVESVDRQAYVDAVIDRKDEQAGFEIVLDAAQGLERSGAEFIVMSCNDIHRFVPKLEEKISTPFLHIAEATAHEINRAKIDKVALLGVRKTMEEDFYPDMLSRYGIATIIPNEDEKSAIHDSILNELVKDVFRESTRNRYIAIIDDLCKRGAQGVVLGCTEIPLLIRENDVDKPTFSTTSIHCRAAIDRAIAAP